MKKLLLLTCMLLQLFCLDGMAMQAADMRAMGLPTVFSPEIPALSSLQNEESNYTAELKPIEEKYFYDGKPLFFNKQIVQFKIKLIPKIGVDAQTIEDPEKEGWKIEWDWGQAPFEKPIRDDNGIYSFIVDYNSQAPVAHYPLDAFLSKDGEVGIRGILDLYVTHYPEPSAKPEKDTCYVNLPDTTYAELKVIPTGGNPNCWTYEWSENGDPIPNNIKSPSCTIYYDSEKGLKREIKVRVKNSRTEGAEWYDTTFTYQVIFREEYNLTLKAEKAEPGKKEFIVLENKKIDVAYILKNVNQESTIDSPENNGWKAKWEWNNKSIEIKDGSFTPTYDGTGEPITGTLKLTLTNEEKSRDLTDFLTFHVYPAPNIETNKDEVENKKYKTNETVPLEVKPIGGITEPGAWKYSWQEDGETLIADPTVNTYTVNYNDKPGVFTRTIKMVATNGPEEDWLREKLEEVVFTIEFQQPGEYSVKLSSDHQNVLAGKKVPITVSFTLEDEETGETKEVDWKENGWTPTWKLNDEEIELNEKENGTFLFTPQFNGEEKYQEQTLTLTFTNESYEVAPTHTIKFNVYPEPKPTQDPADDITATIGRPVELKIHTTGGNPDLDSWKFEWKDNGQTVEEEKESTYTIEDNGTPERIVTVKVMNFGPDKDLWYEKLFTFNVKFEENPYKIELLALPEGKPENTIDVIHGDKVKVIYRLLENGEPVESLDGWNIEWEPKDRVKSDDEKSCIFTPQYDSDNDIDSYSEDKLSLTLRNDKSGAFALGSITFRVYKEPIATPKQGEQEVNIDQEANLEIAYEGGYDQGWSFVWPENDDFIKSDDNKCTVRFDGQNLTRKIEVTVSNVAYKEDSDAKDVYLYGPKTLEFIVHFKNPYTIELETAPEGIRDVLNGEEIPINLTLKEDGNPIDLDETWTVTLEPKDRFVRNDDGTFSYTAKHEGEDNPSKDKITVTLRKDGIDPITESIEFMVYQKPDAENDPADNPIIAYTNAGVPLRVDYHGGNPDGWEFEWTENGDDLKVDKKKNEYFAEYTNYPSRTIRVTVVNKSPDGETWFEEDFEFVIEFKEPLCYEVELSVDDENVLDGNDVQLSFTLYKVENESRSEVKDLDEWTLTWDPVDLIQEKGGKYFFTAQCQEDGESCEQTVTLTLKKDEFDESDSVTVTIWPQPVIADGQGWLDAAEFKDLNNPLNKLQKGIRAGNKLDLPEETPDISINHEWEGYEWKYVWSVDGKEYDDVVDIPTKSDDQYSLEITCLAQYTNGKDVMWEKVVGTRTLNVFKMPPTPTYFVQKGNGTSNTWIISGFKKESSKDRLAVGTYKTNGGLTEVKAISESINATITENGTGWFIMEGHRDAKDLCLYTVRDYGDNVVITSDILPVNLTSVVKWDGSTYENRGILPQSAPSVTGVYSIDGVKTNSMVRGLNIIRLEDGTVRKVFKK